MNRLKIENGSRAGEVVDLASSGLTLGSDAKASAVAFEDSLLASVHFRIAPVKGGGFGIQDLGSLGGTVVNGKRVTAHRLVHGDRIQAGGLTWTFETSDSVAALPPTPVPVPPPPVKAAPVSNTDTPAPTGRAQDPDLSGKTLGGYQIEKILGRGGMGTVYKATQTSLHRTVALKVLSPALARDPKFVEMFLKEARGAAQLHHPNVVTIFDVGSDGEYHYFSMEIFEGGSVEQLLRREKKLDAARALAMVRDAAAALDFAEAKRVLHRDVKPDNLMISAHGVVKLADLGLAVRRGEVSAARIGTPHFLAPECIRGGTVDHRADLYALGATLFRLLTGRTPFQGANVNEILENAQTKEAPALRTLDSTIPEPVEALVAKLLQKDPAKRPANSKEVLAAIDAILGPGSAAAPSKVKKIAAGIAVLAALVLAAIVLFKPKPADVDKPTLVRDTATETRLMREKEAKERELREKDAELALARIPEKLTPAERISRFESIVKDFTGTPAAVRAQQEAERVRLEEAARVERERVKAAAVGQYRIDLERRIQDNLTAGRFADAIAAPKGLEGFQDAMDDPDAKAAIEVVPERVTSAVETQTKDHLNRALELRNAGKLDEAYKAYQKLAESLRSLIALPRDEVGDARLARFQTLLTSVEGSMKELAKGRDEVLARNVTAARTSARKLLLAAFDGARTGKPAPLTELAAFDGASLGDDSVKAFWGEIQVNARAYATYLTRLQDANVSKDFGAETFVDPLTGKPARIVGFDDGGLRFESKPGAPPTGVPLDRFGAVKVNQLFARFTARTSDAALLLSRATLFASWAFDTGRLVQYEQGLKLDAASFEPPPAAEDDGFQAALDSLQSAGDGAAAAAEPLRKQIESERAATRKLREGLTAFAAGRYGDAERSLSEFLTTARGSVAHFLASSSTAAATPPK